MARAPTDQARHHRSTRGTLQNDIWLDGLKPLMALANGPELHMTPSKTFPTSIPQSDGANHFPILQPHLEISV